MSELFEAEEKTPDDQPIDVPWLTEQLGGLLLRFNEWPICPGIRIQMITGPPARYELVGGSVPTLCKIRNIKTRYEVVDLRRLLEQQD